MKFVYIFLIIQSIGCIASAQIKISPIRYNESSLPIKPARTVSFTTNEGTYLDVDISPDGSTILFSCLGELFSLSAKGGVATQLTRGLAINRCPIWSPDGKLIAYESDATGFDKLHVTNLTGSFNKTLDVKTFYDESLKPIWFPDSKQIVVYNQTYNLAGMTSPLPQQMQNVLGFSNEGRFIYSWEYISGDSAAIVKYDRDNQDKMKVLVLSPKLLIFNNPRMSPDGNLLTYIKTAWSPNDIYTPADSLMMIDLKTGKEKLLARLNIKFPSKFIKNQQYSFSKDSKNIFIGYGGQIHRIEIETGKNDIIPFTANVKVDMGPLVYNKCKVSLDSLEVKYIRSAHRSPDGKHLVFSALNKIYIQDLPKGKPHILVDQPIGQFEPTYSPDGKWICYVTWSDKEGGQVWRVPSNGGKPEQLTAVEGLYQHPSWSPDGQMIAIFKGEKKSIDFPYFNRFGQLQIISTNVKDVSIIEDKVPLFNKAVFSGTGDQIIFTPYQEENELCPRLVAKDIRSKAETVIAYARNFEDSDFPIRQTVLSPDGKYCILDYNGDIYLVPMTNIGGAQTIFDNIDHIKLLRFARGAIDPNWEEGGKVLSWVSTNQYCRINPDKIIEAAKHLQPNKTLEGLPRTKIIDVNILAEQTITINLKAPRLYGNGVIALKNARIITMNGSKVIENGTVVIRNGRFVNVGAADKVAIPRDAKIFDVQDKTILPGFVDVHSHMPMNADIIQQQTWQKLLSFSYGITTRRNPSANVDDFGTNELLETGQMLGPRSFSVGNAVRKHYNITSLYEGKIVVSNRKKIGATYIKQYQQTTRLQRQLLLQGCEEEGLSMTNEVMQDPLYCLGMYKDGTTGIEHNPEWGDVYDDVIKLVAKSGTYLCPALQYCYGRVEAMDYFHKVHGQQYLDKSARLMGDGNKNVILKDLESGEIDSGFVDQSTIDARIKRAGGKIVMGSHGNDVGIGAHWEIWALQMGGLTNYEALETATITAAEALGMQKDLGSIEVGKIADLIILDKNPLEDIHNTNAIKYVMKAGVLYESETLEEIWPEKKKCPWEKDKLNFENDN